MYEKQQGQVKTLHVERKGVLQPTAQYLKCQLGTEALAWFLGKIVTQRATNVASYNIQTDVKSENAKQIETAVLVKVTKFK